MRLSFIECPSSFNPFKNHCILAYTEHSPPRFFLAHVGQSLIDLSVANEKKKHPRAVVTD